MTVRAVTLTLLCCSCAPEPTFTPPLIPESATVTAPSTRPVTVRRPFESKTIGADPYPVHGASNEPRTSSAPAAPATPGADPWSPTPVYGVMNPSPPGPATPLYGDLNPSPPGR